MSPTVVLLAKVLAVKNILLPVNSSDPANTTKVSASPNDIPISMVWNGDFAAANGAPMLNIRMIPSPT
ncbi:hypothetical protein D1872_270500 [compost metagenome]